MAADAKTERRSRKQSKPRGWPRRDVQTEELLNGAADDDDDEFEGRVNSYKEQEVTLRQRSKMGSVRKSSRTRKSLSYTEFGDNDPIDSEDDIITRSYKNDSNSLFTNNDSEKYSESSNSLLKPKASRNLKPNAKKTLLGVGRQKQVLGKTDNQKQTRSGGSVKNPVDSFCNSDNVINTPDNLEVDKDTDNSKEADTAATPKRSRSRLKAKKGQAHAVLRNRDLSQPDHSFQSEADLDQNLEEAEEPVTNKRTKGKSTPKTPKSSATSTRGAKSSAKLKGLKSSDLKCKHCDEEMLSIESLQRHMMSKHSVVWSKSNPLGEEAPGLIIKALGHVDCQQCQKQFRFAHYYKHHQIWCGREEELATCEICKHTVRAMWLHQHMNAHKNKADQLALEEKRKKDVEVEDDGVQEVGKRRKRQAAKSAIKLINSFTMDGEDVENISDEHVEEEREGSDEESGSDIEDDECEMDDVDIEERPKRSYFSEGRHIIDSSSAEKKWSSICFLDANMTQSQRLEILHKFYDSIPKDPIFTDLQPHPSNWSPLDGSEREKYLPLRQHSVKFTCGLLGHTTDHSQEEMSLNWGQSVIRNGKPYCYTGGPVWALEWCPLPEGVESEQFFAVALDLTADEKLPSTTNTSSGRGIVQIWSAGVLKNEKDCTGDLSIKYCIAHESGYCVSMSWCPGRCYDEEEHEDGSLRRLGLLAVACSDGSVLVYSLPQPNTLEAQHSKDISIYYPSPAVTLVPNSQTGCGPCLCTAWQQGGNHEQIVAGYGRGNIFVWDLVSKSPLLRVNDTTLRPLQCFKFNTEGILSCTWNPQVPSSFATSSFDGSFCQWDTNMTYMPVGTMRQSFQLFVHRSLCWAGPMQLGFFSSAEKFNMTDKCPVTFHGLSRNGTKNMGTGLAVQNHAACIWDVSYCPFYEVLVSCDAIGKARLTLPPMMDVRTKAVKNHGIWYKSACPMLDVYQAKLIKKNDVDSQLDLLGLSRGQMSEVTGSSRCFSTLDILGACQNFNAEEIVHYLDSPMTKDDLTLQVAKSSGKTELEDFGGSNTNAVHKIRLNPNAWSCLWMISGGQAGLLRLDNLSPVVQPHKVHVKRFYDLRNSDKLSQSKKNHW
ncbi:general transcription factor 3C polypeptide 2-like [Physella acuta]|uniref:general transcription factor 3C polypeptide 2-like n=1 Tax=Physella acuta TaxID=109671 RepID=UPI0027DC7DAB|nr:general transcription factor 3C polypeptide 2-like [Physella acuta]